MVSCSVPLQAQQKALNRVGLEAVLLRCRHWRVRVEHSREDRDELFLRWLSCGLGFVQVARGFEASWHNVALKG